jgi:UDP-3-O-[3-hydroxymyristoyl] glucosamine N-acyltransferase
MRIVLLPFYSTSINRSKPSSFQEFNTTCLYRHPQQKGENIFIGAFAYLGEQVIIGNNVKIFPNAYIGSNVTIGDNTIIHPSVKIYHNCVVGKNVVIHAGTVIGSDGFGFAPQPDGSFKKVPQIGNVVIEDNVEIGANAAIDRATLGSTI